MISFSENLNSVKNIVQNSPICQRITNHLLPTEQIRNWAHSSKVTNKQSPPWKYALNWIIQFYNDMCFPKL